MLFGDADARAVAKRMIHELFDKAADAKAKQRQDEKDYKAKKRERAPRVPPPAQKRLRRFGRVVGRPQRRV